MTKAFLEVKEEFLFPVFKKELFNPINALSVQQANQMDFSTFFSQLPFIRIIVSNYRGVGNASASYSVGLRLRELGYQGKLQYVFDNNSDLHRLSTIYPELLTPKKINAEIIVIDEHYENFVLSFCPLTMTGAEDTKKNHECLYKYNTACYIQLNPNNWRDYDRFIFSLTSPTQLILPSIGGHIYAKNRVEVEFPECLEKLFSMQVRGDCYIQSIYGLHPSTRSSEETGCVIAPNVLLSRMVSALQAAIPNQKNVVILIHNDLTDYEMSVQNTVICETVSAAISILTDSNDHAQKILLVPIGLLPRALFHKIQLTCFLPPMVEGCNAMTELFALGKPFLHGGGTFSYTEGPMGIEVIDKQFPRIRQLHVDACGALRKKNCDASDILVLSDFLNACVRQLPSLKKYFLLRKDYFFSEQTDIVATGILASRMLGFPLTLNQFTLQQKSIFSEQFIACSARRSAFRWFDDRACFNANRTIPIAPKLYFTHTGFFSRSLSNKPRLTRHLINSCLFR